jgi:hypothetical protein
VFSSDAHPYHGLLPRAQQPAMPVIGYIGTGSRESDAFRLPSFHKA